jgi:hypothetical protein
MLKHLGLPNRIAQIEAQTKAKAAIYNNSPCSPPRLGKKATRAGPLQSQPIAKLRNRLES